MICVFCISVTAVTLTELCESLSDAMRTAVHAMCAPEDEERQIVWEPDRARWEPVNSIQTMSSPKPAQMSRKFAAFLLVLTCFDSFVVCESYLLNSKVNRSIQRAVISFKEP